MELFASVAARSLTDIDVFLPPTEDFPLRHALLERANIVNCIKDVALRAVRCAACMRALRSVRWLETDAGKVVHTHVAVLRSCAMEYFH